MSDTIRSEDTFTNKAIDKQNDIASKSPQNSCLFLWIEFVWTSTFNKIVKCYLDKNTVFGLGIQIEAQWLVKINAKGEEIHAANNRNDALVLLHFTH